MIEKAKKQHLDFLGKNIICQFMNEKLKSALSKCAKEIGCVIWEADSSDIIAVPAIMSIVDRRIVGKNDWDIYVQASKEGMDFPPCLIIDSLKSWPLPNIKCVKQFDMKKPSAIKNIIITVKNIRNNTLPKEWQNKKLPIVLVKGQRYDESKGVVTEVYFKWSGPAAKK